MEYFEILVISFIEYRYNFAPVIFLINTCKLLQYTSLKLTFVLHIIAEQK